LEILDGLVVPKGSKVLQGISILDVPSLEASQSSLKLLFGNIKRKKSAAYDEDEMEPVPVAKPMDDDNESMSLEEESDEDDDESEEVETEDDE